MPTVRIEEFDIWQPGYDTALVTIYKAGTENLADVFTDEALTAAAANPQTLGSRTVDDVSYGKFNQSLYTAQAYDLDIDSTDQTGIVRPPITTLVDEAASEATVIAEGGSEVIKLETMFGRIVHVQDYGEFKSVADSGVASTNNATLLLAIAAVAANSGGIVLLPAGTFAFTAVTLSVGVKLRGHGRGVTILQSQTAGEVLAISGDKAGLIDMDLDGVDLQAGSVGIDSKANDMIYMQNATVKRFETGMHLKGAKQCMWLEFYIENCTTGIKGHGDIDSGGGSDGAEFRNNIWLGGQILNCTGTGLHLSYVDLKCIHNTIQGVEFKDNVGTAIDINGARYTKLIDCDWNGNTGNLAVDDDSDTDAVAYNTVIGLLIAGGSMDGGTVDFTGVCQDVLLDRMELADVDFSLTSLVNNIVVRDSTEDSLVTISGDGTKYHRTRSINGDMPGSAGITFDAVATKAWAYRLAPGQVGIIRAMVVGVQRNGTDYAIYHIARGCRRAGSTLDYDNQTDNFTVGEIVTGATSGTTARIIADADSGANGTLTLKDIIGEFVDNESISGETTGAALADGVMTHAAATLLGSITSIQTAVETDAAWACIFDVSGDGEVEVHVTGAASKTVEWTVAGELVAS